MYLIKEFWLDEALNSFPQLHYAIILLPKRKNNISRMSNFQFSIRNILIWKFCTSDYKITELRGALFKFYFWESFQWAE